ncbi:hypothetical protein ElyMa_003007500 [Elysia marginata]|uniref:ABC transmembrane type-1 domain-containing protein n=1 Tax=Elysia marginata TaxID=1093978 RepID=A0AAV4ICF0_9GAST|nr:hypothetical protein ElyMa_003007500 [Elysia marginata]
MGSCNKDFVAYIKDGSPKDLVALKSLADAYTDARPSKTFAKKKNRMYPLWPLIHLLIHLIGLLFVQVLEPHVALIQSIFPGAVAAVSINLRTILIYLLVTVLLLRVDFSTNRHLHLVLLVLVQLTEFLSRKKMILCVFSVVEEDTSVGSALQNQLLTFPVQFLVIPPIAAQLQYSLIGLVN